jgi:hypothetical protein
MYFLLVIMVKFFINKVCNEKGYDSRLEGMFITYRMHSCGVARSPGLHSKLWLLISALPFPKSLNLVRHSLSGSEFSPL